MESPDPATRYLFSLLGSIRGSNFGLGRMQRLMDALGHPERDPGMVHVAGTNGKGSTAAMIESGLRAAGRSTGLYTSPHLCRLAERFLLDGRPAEASALTVAVELVRRANERIVARHGGGAHPTFFESATAAALVLFRQAGAAWRVVETGLGGRLDASNVLRPRLAVLTRIDRDHERFLGLGLRAIAGEKGAIVKPECLAVLGPQQPAAREVLLRCCAEAGAPVVDVERNWRACNAASVGGRWRFDAVGPGLTVPVQLALAGAHQIENALIAVAALDALDVPADRIAAGLRRTRWPGRLEFFDRAPRVLLDAAHNPHGARALADFLRQEASGKRVALVYGASRDKAVDEMAAWLFPCADRIVLTSSRVQRAARPEALLRAVGHHHPAVATAPAVGDAMRLATAAAGADGWVVVAGSLFLVGEARALLG